MGGGAGGDGRKGGGAGGDVRKGGGAGGDGDAASFAASLSCTMSGMCTNVEVRSVGVGGGLEGWELGLSSNERTVIAGVVCGVVGIVVGMGDGTVADCALYHTGSCDWVGGVVTVMAASHIYFDVVAFRLLTH